MPRRTIRLTADVDERLQSTVKTRGYANPSAFLRAAIDHELRGREDTMIGAEERLATSMEQMRREIFRLGRAQQALFAFVDSLAKILLTCVPEPRRGGDGSGCREGARPARPAAQERGPGDGRRLAVGNAGVGEPWRRMKRGSSGFGPGSRPPGTSAQHGLRPTRSSCIMPA